MKDIILFIVIPVLAIAGNLGAFIYCRRVLSEKKLMIKQNLVYLISFTNYFLWIDKAFKDNMLQVVSTDPELIEFFNKAGVSIPVFIERFDRTANVMHNQLRAKSAECLNDIKVPLDKEVAHLIDIWEGK